MSKVRVLSCIPKQLNDCQQKMDWLENICATQNTDVVCLPQEFFGGAVMMEHQKAFTEDALFPVLKELSIKYDKALVIGLVEKFKGSPYNKEAIWFIDKGGILRGKIYKMALPSYDHFITHGYGNIEPELSWENRFKTFEICGLQVSAIFCWEAFSNVLWSGLSLLKPHLIFSMIKFGVNAWPQLETVSPDSYYKEKRVKGFGYAGWNSTIWIDRLYCANHFQVYCPIVCSTNSWNLRPASKPLCGTISRIKAQAEDTLWMPKQEDKLKEIPEKIIIDEFDKDKIELGCESKFEYVEKVGEWPPFSDNEYTMLMKVKRLEERLITGKEEARVLKKKTRASVNKKAGSLFADN